MKQVNINSPFCHGVFL